MKIKWTKKIEDFIVDKMINESLQPAQVLDKYKDKLPSKSTYYRKLLDSPEFKEKINIAYTVLLDNYTSEINTLSNGLASDHYPDADFREAEAALTRRIRALSFVLGKLAPVLSTRYNTKQVVQHEGQIDTQHVFIIPDYSQPELIEKEIKDLDDTEQ